MNSVPLGDICLGCVCVLLRVLIDLFPSFSLILLLLLLFFSYQVMSNSYAKPARLLCPWDFPGKNTGCHFLLQEISVLGWNPALAWRFFTTEPPGKPLPCCYHLYIYLWLLCLDLIHLKEVLCNHFFVVVPSLSVLHSICRLDLIPMSFMLFIICLSLLPITSDFM